jgi:hypothetical protein
LTSTTRRIAIETYQRSLDAIANGETPLFHVHGGRRESAFLFFSSVVMAYLLSSGTKARYMKNAADCAVLVCYINCNKSVPDNLV